MGSPADLLDDLGRGELHVLFLRSRWERSYGLREQVLGEDPPELVMCPVIHPKFFCAGTFIFGASII